MKNLIKLKMITVLTCGIIGHFVSAQDLDKKVFEDKFEKYNQWSQNPASKTAKYGGGGKFSLVDSGKEGKCLKVITNEKQTFMMNMRKPFFAQSGKKLSISWFAKGTGTVQFVIMGRGKKISWYTTRKIKIENKEWKEYSVIVSLSPKKEGPFEKAVIRMNVFPGADILIDDMGIKLN